MTRVPRRSVAAIAMLACLGLLSRGALAEISVDGSLGGPAGPIGKVDNNYLITEDLGHLRGSNLFHSFSQFDIGTGESATFSGPSAVENILSRVTGGSASHIDGTIRSTYPDASLYLMNPHGIVFGPNASLDVQGSFHATTADYIRHSDAIRFNATPVSGETLSTAPPAAFGFLGNNYPAISVQESVLQVPTGETLSLIGGKVDITRNSTDDPSTLVASGGRINLASVASPGEVVPAADDLHMNGFGELGTLSVRTPDADNSYVTLDTSGDPSGSIYIRAGRFTMENTTMTSATRGAQDHPGTGIDIEVSGEMRLDRSEIASSSFGDGRAGNLKITAGSLELAGDAAAGVNANIGSRAFAAGDAGDLELDTQQLTIRNNAFINSNALGPGTGGDIKLTTGSLEVLGEDGIAFVSTLSANGATGDGGNLEITADSILLQSRVGFTGLTTQVNSTGLGNAGDIRINTGRLEVLDGAEISTAVFNGPGDAGDLAITADSMRVSGVNANDINASISSSVFWNESGNTTGSGGDISIATGDLVVTDKGSITTRNFSNGPGDGGGIDVTTDTLEIAGGGFLSSTRLNLGTGRAGDINIDARDIRIAGPSPEGWPTGIFTLASVAASGAGAVNISTDNLQLLDGAVINSRTFGPGTGGTVSITANRMLVAGRDPVTGSPAGIDARTLVFPGFENNATGRGGNVQIQARELDLLDAGVITTASGSAGDGGDIVLDANRITLDNAAAVSAESSNTGNAGSIRITAAESVNIKKDSSITTKAEFSGGGRINIRASDLVYLLDAGITSSVADGIGNGGDITIDPVFVVLNSGRILANASSGDGGNILIITDNFIATPDSVIDASSKFGLDGTVIIKSPAADLNSGLTELPASFLNVSALLREPCSARRSVNQSSFIVRGRSAIPPGPMSPLPVMNTDFKSTSASGGNVMTAASRQLQPGPGVTLAGLSGAPFLAASLIECGL